VKTLKRRILKLERKLPEPSPFEGLSLEELREIIFSHEWTEEELDAVAQPFNITYRRLLDIVRQ
jgi:hypothetical protein